MSAENRIKIPKVADTVLYKCFTELSLKYNVNQISITAIGFANLGNIDTTEEPDDTLKLLLSKNSALIETSTVNIQGFSLSFYRGGNYQQQDKSGIFDEVIIRQSNQNDIADVDKIEITSFVLESLKAFDPKRTITQSTPEQEQLLAIHNSTLERLEELNEGLIRKNSEFRRQLEKDQRQKIKTIEETSQKKQASLEEHFAKKEDSVSELEQHFKKRLEEIDDRDNRHARRSLRETLQKEIASRQTKFGLTPNTVNLRKPIHILCVVLITTFATGSIWYSKNFFELALANDLPTYQLSLMSLKPLSLTFGAIGMAIFYLRWMNRWFEQHSHAEFHLQQFQLDVDRASWVVETALEWKTSLGSIIPTVLLESITKNLFNAEGKPKEADLHPGDQLASALLGTASKVRVKAGNAELDFSGKDLKKEMQDKK